MSVKITEIQTLEKAKILSKALTDLSYQCCYGNPALGGLKLEKLKCHEKSILKKAFNKQQSAFIKEHLQEDEEFLFSITTRPFTANSLHMQTEIKQHQLWLTKLLKMAIYFL